MIWKLLRKNISATQIAGYAIANLIGLAIVVCAIRFYSDVSTAYNDEDSFVSKDYMIISKPVTALNTMGFGNDDKGFTTDEVADLERQPWVRRVGAFTAADFQVQASVAIGNQGLSTYLFLESIPDDFLDVMPDEWAWKPGEPVPVIISRDYLALYNFGFAASRGMPQLSEGIISSVPMALTLGAGTERQTFKARIVGFSSRLNTIAVPQVFMEWANRRFGDPAHRTDPSRLILEVSKPGDPAVEKYMKRHDYDIAGDRADNSRANYFLRLVTGIVVTVGIIITLLAFFILTLSIFLLLQKSRTKLHNLMLLGYTPQQAAQPYYRLVCIVNGTILVLSAVIMFIASSAWGEKLGQIDIHGGSPWPSLLTGLALVLLVTAGNVLTIRKIVRKAF